MSDNIHENDYVGEFPAWHGKGVNLGRMFDAREAIEYANLDYEAQKVPLFIVDRQDEIVQEVDRCATVRMDLPANSPDHVLGIVGRSYTVVQNRDAFEFFNEVTGDGAAYFTSAGVLGHGEKIFLVAKLPLDYWVEKDKFESFVTLVSGHDGMNALKVFTTSVRVVCQNTLNMALKQTKLSVSLRHTRNVYDRLLEAPAILGLATLEFRKTQELFQALAKQPITVPLFNQYVEELFPSEKPNRTTLAHRESVTMLFDDPLNATPNIKHTYYAAAQAVIQYVDHNKPLYKGKDRFEDGMFGGGATLKTKAVDLAAKYVFGEV